MHDARGDLDLIDGRKLGLGPLQNRAQPGQRQPPRVVVNLQRADAGREVDDAGKLVALEPLHERVRAEAQREVEHERAVFDQQILVARAAVAHFDPVLRGREVKHDRRRDLRRRGEGGGGLEAGRLRIRGKRVFNAGILRALHFHRLRVGERDEAHGVAGLELAHLPELGLHDGHRADETAEARPVRAEDDRHVAGEIDRADGVGVVVDVRGVQPASPPSARAHSGFGPIRRTPVRPEL